jgi:hypothetical protein
MARKTFATTVEETLQNGFKKKCKDKDIKMNEALEALIQAFITDQIDIEVNTSYTVTSTKK